MFDILLGLVAIANVGIELCSTKAAIENPGTSDCKFSPAPELTPEEKEKKERRRLLEEADLAYKHTNRITNSQRKIYKRSEVIAEMNKPAEAEKIDDLASWIMNHDDIIIDILEPGKHLISYKDLGGVKQEELADFLFKQSNIESVEQVNEGLEIVTR